LACACSAGYKQASFYNITVGVVGYCAPATAKINQTCDAGDGAIQCSGDHTYCPGGTLLCTCWPGYTADSDLTDCTRIPVTLLGQNCSGSINSYNYCGYGAMCKDTICQCLPGYTNFNTTDCTHYEPGKTCSVDECDDALCAFGTCESGEFQCTKGMKWYSWQVDANLVDGTCIPVEDWVVGQGHYCEANVMMFAPSADRLCGHNLVCASCREQPLINMCLGNGAAGSFQLMTSAVVLISSIVLSLNL